MTAFLPKYEDGWWDEPFFEHELQDFQDVEELFPMPDDGMI